MKLTPVMSTMNNMRSVQNNNYQQSPNFGVRICDIRKGIRTIKVENYNLPEEYYKKLRQFGLEHAELYITGVYKSDKPELEKTEVKIYNSYPDMLALYKRELARLRGIEIPKPPEKVKTNLKEIEVRIFDPYRKFSSTRTLAGDADAREVYEAAQEVSLAAEMNDFWKNYDAYLNKFKK